MTEKTAAATVIGAAGGRKQSPERGEGTRPEEEGAKGAKGGAAKTMSGQEKIERRGKGAKRDSISRMRGRAQPARTIQKGAEGGKAGEEKKTRKRD